MYKIEIKKSVLKTMEILRVNKYAYYKKIIEIFEILKSDPIPYRSAEVKKIKGYPNTYRIRVGDIRILYKIYKKDRRLVIYDIDYRGRIY